MRASVRFAIVALVLLSSVVLFTRHFRDIRSTWDGYRAAPHHDDAKLHQPSVPDTTHSHTATSEDISYVTPTVSSATELSTLHDDGHHPTATPGSKVIVMARLESEDTDWVAQELPDWDRAIYTVDNPNATLHTPINKGREAMAYLTYIIDHYSELPETIVFIHSHKDGYPKAWHTDAEAYDNVASLKALNIGFVQRNGYANLRCIFIPGCPDEIQPFREPWEGHRRAEHLMPDVWRYMFQNDQVPKAIGAACCSQFAVSRRQVHLRPVSDYERFRQWLFDTKEDDDSSGRVMEYLWHIFFGQDPVYCPELETCYCEVYGRCKTSSETAS